jgi:hypothetical protein
MNRDQILSQLYENSPIYFKHENVDIDLNLEIDENELEISYVDDENFDIYISSSKIIKNYKKMVNSSDINVNNKIQIKYNIKKISNMSCISYLSQNLKLIAEISANDDPLIKSTLKLITYSIFKVGVYSKKYIKCDTYYSNF